MRENRPVSFWVLTLQVMARERPTVTIRLVDGGKPLNIAKLLSVSLFSYVKPVPNLNAR